jgi:phosphoglucosamine mutase
MANMGLEAALREAGAAMSRTAVGDKYVLEEMLESGAMLGGEQSGHIIFREFATTGDGLLTARIMLEILAAEGKPLSELARRLPVFPQTLRNLRVGRKVPFEDAPPLRDAVAASEKELGPRGRVVVRYSGTEPLVRIMVEADDEALMEAHASRLANVFERYLSA